MQNPILARMEALGYAVFTGRMNLNIVGIRRTTDPVVDTFDDRLHVIYQPDDGAGLIDRSWPVTTDPGLYYLMNKSKQLNPAGTAILVPGQYRGVYKIDGHGVSRYASLCQRLGPVSVFRDNNHDDVIDYGHNEQAGMYGVNIHAPSTSPYRRGRATVRTKIGPWSAGCTVFSSVSDFRQFMVICKGQVAAGVAAGKSGYDRFTYSLLEEF